MIDHTEHAVTLSEATTLALSRPVYVRLRGQAGTEINSCDEIRTYSTTICRALFLETCLTILVAAGHCGKFGVTLDCRLGPKRSETKDKYLYREQGAYQTLNGRFKDCG